MGAAQGAPGRSRSVRALAHKTFVAALRHDGLDAPWVIDEAMNSEMFDLYFETQLAPSLHQGAVVILNNLSRHKSPGAAVTLRNGRAYFLFLPPYRPDLKPVETVFSKLKALIRKAAARPFGLSIGIQSCPRRRKGVGPPDGERADEAGRRHRDQRHMHLPGRPVPELHARRAPRRRDEPGQNRQRQCGIIEREAPRPASRRGRSGTRAGAAWPRKKTAKAAAHLAQPIAQPQCLGRTSSRP